METDLTELCVRVWGKVPGSMPSQLAPVAMTRRGKHGATRWALDWKCPGHAGRWKRVTKRSRWAVEAIIRDACVLWLLHNDGEVVRSPGTGYVIARDLWENGTVKRSWFMCSPDPTVALLRGVEACYEHHLRNGNFCPLRSPIGERTPGGSGGSGPR